MFNVKVQEFKEEFQIFVHINGDERYFSVIPSYNESRKVVHFEIWKNNIHLFSLFPEFDDTATDLFSWFLDEKYYGIDEETINQIGNAIDQHYS